MVRRLLVAATVSAVLLGSGPAESVPARISMTTVQSVDAGKAPRGPEPTVPWLDATNNTIHDGTTTLTLPFGGVGAFRRGGGGFVVQTGSRLYLARATSTILLTHRLKGEFRVATGVGLGSQVAFRGRAGHGRHRHTVIRVIDLTTTRVVRTLRVTRYGGLKYYRDGQPEALYNGVLWTNLGGHLATWNIATGRVRLLRRPTADSVDPVHSYAQHRVTAGDYPYSRYFPISSGATWSAWTTADPGQIAWSADGRYVATFRYADPTQDMVSWVTIRDALTGAPVAAFYPESSFYPPARPGAAVESDGSVLVSAGSSDTPEQMALMRLGSDGAVQRTTDMHPVGSSPAIPAQGR